MQQFYYKKIIDTEDAIILGCHSNGKDIQEARISLNYGANLCQYSFNGKKIIDYEPELLRSHDFTGTPILYPTPNRVENGVIKYKGKLFSQVKRNRQIFEHGLVYDEPWKLKRISTEKDRVVLEAKID